MARSGWRTAGLIAGVGCLSIIAVVIGGVIIASMYARATLANLGDTNPQPVERHIALPAPAATTPAPAGKTATRATKEGADRTAPLRLTLDLQEGTFTIRPGEPGSDVQVQGKYAPGLYELTENQDTDAATGVRRARVRFRSKAPAWARFFAGMTGNSSDPPELTIVIPRGTPIDLSLNLALGKSEVDLGGLTLGEVSISATMGEHRIDFQQPVVEGLSLLRLNSSMGNVTIEHLGNARADRITATSNMGNVIATLDGTWPSGTPADLNFQQTMGDLTLRVPTSVRLDAEVRNAKGETTNAPSDVKPPDDPKAPTLRLRVTSSMGNARVIRY
jgi:hypothetical protein